MSGGEFKPFGEELQARPAAQFVKRGIAPSDSAASPASEDKSTTPPTPVRPAEEVSLPTKIREALSGLDLPDDQLKQAVDAVNQAVNEAPLRLALPELKVQHETTGEADDTERQPTIELEKEENKVNRIKVNCVCGETIVLDCVS